MTTGTHTTETDVLVVGAGPTGLATSAFLARDGVDAVTVTKHPGTSPTPRAHITNQRTMEVFRDLGIEDEVRAVGTPLDAAGEIVWAVSFAGVELGRLAAWGTGASRRSDYALASPCPMYNVPQHVLEPVLLRGVRDRGADVRFGHELLGLEQDGTGVLARVVDRASGTGYRVRARYLVGADGGRSTVAREAGFSFDGDTGPLNWAANVWLEADLTEHCAHRPGVLYWFHQPGEDLFSSTWIAVRPWHEWVMTVVYPAGQEPPRLDRASAVEQARRMIGDPAADVRIKDISPWSIRSAVATEYRRGRVLLAGDSAHRHPPPNGLGSNTGVQDAFNLSWKLAAVLSGRAGPGLLDTYDTERRPVGRAVVDRAMRSLGNLIPLPEAFGLAPGRSEREGWARIGELSEPGERGGERRAALRRVLDLQQHQYNCHGVELGQWYDSTAVAGAGSRPLSDVDSELHHRPSTVPGAPLPHAWVERDRTRTSTVDIVGRGSFTVVAGVDGADWVAATGKVSTELGVPVRAVTVGYHQEYHDVYGDWAVLSGVGESGCLLVRPDRHVAWRSETAVPDPAGALAGALTRLLARR